MKLLSSLPVITSIGVVVAEVSRRGISVNGADFASKIFDYVIIGGGTAGLTVAARLSEDPKTTVGVIETGEYLPDDPLINTPSSAFSIYGNAKYDWLFKTVPQANVNNRVLDLPRGKVLGGSSAINVMVFDRASKVEYDAWAKLGNPGWDWNGLLPNMKNAERFTGIDPFRANYTNADPTSIFPSQGRNGPVAGSYNNWYGDITVPFFKSMANLSIPTNFDPDSGNAYGVFNSATSVNRTTGKRSYAASTYYAYNSHRSNFIVLTGAQATKINFKDKNSDKPEKVVATGVSFVHKSQTYTVKAKKEVILAAGAFQSPQLLELSGIGNATILKNYGIKPLVDLPGVGENYQDHIFATTTYELKPGSSFQDMDTLRNNATFAAAAAAQYNATQDGILSYSGSIISFFNLEPLATSAEIANLTAQLDREIASEKLTPLEKASYKIQKEWLKEKVGLVEVIMNPGYAGSSAPKANTSYMSLVSAIQHPFSRGNIHINSSNPLVAPRIDPNYFSKSIDLQTLVQTVRFGHKLSKTEPLASLVVARQDPAPEVTSNSAIIEYVKANAASIHHPIGTAALAPREIGGVVDVDLKVYGTANVRVVDASVIPLHIGTHIQRTVYGIAEKAANIIKGQS
ncbi:GMC oxidoreductase [Rhizoctonia solani]|uniref:GMC oxidoreductase n=1 Tax=Rhizoctonia solani TaxID=456999 RepID=A0A8H7HA38_9AGAM|nr:GMC oxidoreductase [Rhizoctonia solani]